MKVSGTLIMILIAMVLAIIVVAIFFLVFEPKEKNIYIPVTVILFSLWMIFVVKFLRKKI
jgi:hypothetical protein